MDDVRGIIVKCELVALPGVLLLGMMHMDHCTLTIHSHHSYISQRTKCHVYIARFKSNKMKVQNCGISMHCYYSGAAITTLYVYYHRTFTFPVPQQPKYQNSFWNKSSDISACWPVLVVVRMMCCRRLGSGTGLVWNCCVMCWLHRFANSVEIIPTSSLTGQPTSASGVQLGWPSRLSITCPVNSLS